MLRVGLVGFGMAGRVFHAPLISSVDGLELAAVVERHSDHATQRYPGLTTYRTLDDLLRDASIDLVVVATPSGTHFVCERSYSAGSVELTCGQYGSTPTPSERVGLFACAKSTSAPNSPNDVFQRFDSRIVSVGDGAPLRKVE